MIKNSRPVSSSCNTGVNSGVHTYIHTFVIVVSCEADNYVDLNFIHICM